MQSLKIILASMCLMACSYFAFVQEVSGAKNLLLFFVWCICLPIGLLALSSKIQKALAEKPATPIASAISRGVSWSILAMLIWTGHLATGAAWGAYLLCAAVANHEVKKLRAAPQKS